ncbi:hypothetical protein C819_02732 [Lachnospiraceae bacterium 10-1]|nr:hypothetical protein C819_02732 [Lachnospiraceae bacterium 10-1]
MKNRIKLIFLGTFFVIIICLLVYTIRRTPKCNRVHIDEMIAFGVPDEEVARKIADVVVGIGEEKIYDVTVHFDKESDEWIITYLPKRSSKDDKLSGQKVVKIRKDIGTISVFEN